MQVEADSVAQLLYAQGLNVKARVRQRGLHGKKKISHGLARLDASNHGAHHSSQALVLCLDRRVADKAHAGPVCHETGALDPHVDAHGLVNFLSG